ncbi:tyrosine-type recombinase/integrase [Pseudarthrobacter sp. P1]|uniref:tyrosine-type recombinase/integrase n=1 Tax=Pseudarthrobacter sp. P1 TaxID=3418418 RepID=UPI003CF778CE
MASLRVLTRTDETQAFKVLWRDSDTGKQTSKTFDDPGTADMFLDFLNANGQSLALADRAISMMRSKAPTVKAAIARHIETLGGVESGTLHRYRQLARNHINPKLGPYPVDKLTREDVLAWFNAMTLSAKSKKNIHALLSSALESAIADRHIVENPAKGIRDSKSAAAIKTRDPVFLSPAEFEALTGAFDSRYVTLLKLLAGSGLRFSEATALRKRDVKRKEDRYSLSVTRAWKKTDQGIAIGGPKSPKSIRTVALSKTLTDPINAELAGLKPDDLVFTLPEGGRLPNNRFHENYWDEVVDRLVAEGKLHDAPTPHDLRHTHASWLIAAGVPLPVIQARLGHENITTTVGTYGHLQNDADSLAADALD